MKIEKKTFVVLLQHYYVCICAACNNIDEEATI